jgi:hypothetical protein
MSLAPDDWREWVWDVTTFAAGGGNLRVPTCRLWRVHLYGGTLGGTARLGESGLSRGIPPSNIDVAPNETLVVEPLGMNLFDIDLTGDVSANIEYIRKPV